jgi:pyrroline-5-carboxylate reductase
MSNITILSAGNMGAILVVKFSQKHKICLFVNSLYETAEDYKKNMQVFNEDKNECVLGNINFIR